MSPSPHPQYSRVSYMFAQYLVTGDAQSTMVVSTMPAGTTLRNEMLPGNDTVNRSAPAFTGTGHEWLTHNGQIQHEYNSS